MTLENAFKGLAHIPASYFACFCSLWDENVQYSPDIIDAVQHLALFLCRSFVHQHPVEWCLTPFHSHLIKSTLFTVPSSTLLCITSLKHAHICHIAHHHPVRLSQRPAVQVTLICASVCVCFSLIPFTKFPFRYCGCFKSSMVTACTTCNMMPHYLDVSGCTDIYSFFYMIPSEFLSCYLITLWF